MSQTLRTTRLDEDEPKHDPASSRLLLVQRPATVSGALGERGAWPSAARGLTSARKLNNDRAEPLPGIRTSSSRRGKHPDDQVTKNIIGGHIFWTFLSTSPAGSMFGFLHFLPQVSLLSHKKKCWCVLLDGQLFIYGRVVDLRPKEVIQLSQCHFSVIEKVVRNIKQRCRCLISVSVNS